MQFEHDNDNSVDTFVATLLRKRVRAFRVVGCSLGWGRVYWGSSESHWFRCSHLIGRLRCKRRVVLAAHGSCAESRVIFVVPPAQAHAQVEPMREQVGASVVIMATTGNPESKMVEYMDCCATTSAVAIATRGPSCLHNSSVTDAWCAEGEFYGCTYVRVGNTCSGGSHNPC